MNKKHLLIILLILLVSNISWGQNSTENFKIIDFSKVVINDNFWSGYILRNSTATIPVCIDQIENKTGRMNNFINAAKRSGKHSGIYFDDSDVYKALEGIAYSLINNFDSELEKKADQWIDNIAKAQLSDGYINTFYTLTDLNKRWTNMDKHEMYCAGHLIEAGIAYYEATGKRKLMDVGIKMANHMINVFGPNKRHWITGHEELELALIKLYKATNDKRYLNFSYWLLEERGHGYGYNKEKGKWDLLYHQDQVPVKDMKKIVGHAVRAMYLFCGMSDVAACQNSSRYIPALKSVWNNVVNKKMYITGGIGSSRKNEGFGEDYYLPNLEAYCETCASVGMVLWNSRMNRLTTDSKYVDIFERCIYNGVLSGVSLKGDNFFYVNPLESKGNHHRKPWYGTACCPSQISRFIPSIGNYVYGISENSIYVNLFVGNTTKFNDNGTDIVLTQVTDYPWNGNMSLHFGLNKPYNKELKIYIPEWCKKINLKLNNKNITYKKEKGYVTIKRKWEDGDELQLVIDMKIRISHSNPKVKMNKGKCVIERGPFVYCMEEIDNDNYDKCKINKSTVFEIVDDKISSVNIKKIKATNEYGTFYFIPYFSWDNRESGKMKVWLDYIK